MKLNSTINSIVFDPQYKHRMTDFGCYPSDPLSPEEVRTFVRKEVPIWVQRVRDANMEIQ